MIQRTIHFTPQQYKNFQARAGRVFVARCSFAQVQAEVRRASTIAELERIALQFDMCDYCDFKRFHPDFARTLVEALASVLYRYPRLRAKMSFVGSKDGLIFVLQKLAVLDDYYVRRFALNDVCSDKDLEYMASSGLIMIDNTTYERIPGAGNVLAQALTLHGLLDAMLLDEEDFGLFGYARTKRDLADGSQPQGCTAPISIFYHEVGHLLDYLCGVNSDPTFRRYYEGFSKDQIKRGVSEYAATNAYEFFAEAFAEYMCSPGPRPIARYVGEYIQRKYK